jgi:hypothetical protein
VSDQVGLEEAGSQIVPLAKGPHRHLALEQPTWLGRADAVRAIRLTQTAHHAVGCGGTHAEQLRPHSIVNAEMAVTFKDRDKFRQKRHQALAADTVGRSPDNH